MFKIVLIFFSTIFFFFSYSSGINSLTKNQVIKIKQQVNFIDPLVNKARSKESKLNKEKYKKSKVIFNSIKKKNWSEANKLAKNNEVLKKIVDWHFLNQNNNSKYFNRTKKFVEENPDWPQKKQLRRKMELFINKNLNNKEIIKYFETYPPITTKGAVNYVDALKKEKGLENVKNLIRKTWIERKFTRSQSKDFYKRYKKVLRIEDHDARIEKLTWTGRSYEARRMLPLINKNKKKLYNAKIILRRRAGNADQAISSIDTDLLNDQGLVYERLRWRRKSRLYKTAYDLINPLPNNLKYERKWWYEISIIVRKLIENKEYKKAYYLIKDFSSKSNELLSESEWYAGWIAYEFLNFDSEIHINHFLNSYENTDHKGEKAKSGYWAGRAYEKINNIELSNLWYENSAKYVTEFYGQLSHEKINTNKSLIPNEELYGKNLFIKDDLDFVNSDIYKASELMLANGTRKNAKLFISSLIYNSKSPGQLQIIAKLSKDFDRPDLAIKASKYAEKKNIYLYHYAYPSLKNYKIYKDVEKELVYAVIKQESAFDSKAISRVGARGMMQIMPATANIVSKELKLNYSKKRLTSDVQYNVSLGSYYLYSLIEDYDSYLLALIGYNAGPRRVKRWIKKFGDPRKENVDYDSWIEKIPIKETRLYVKIVLSNLQVYRQKNQTSKKISIFSRKN
ncbi:MAG: Soluble lytic murein transglycosylase [Alphaproteobacteria bacterium MarineAlpha6_Bin5]|nr:MAG: Soluble lytic murein transglycosylase [Alphaproteobacteria bacterium MarineAlpha6_Bin5]|tara:strand:- start:1411 stop:3450 length:2040 start_codon:yes stop_codon:yes gene_type:complete